MSSHPVSGCQREKANTHLATASYQVVVESKVSSGPPPLQAKQLQLPQLLLIRLTYDVSNSLF